jgi:hypothetical protein
MANDLLRELEADHHNELLESGNLRKHRVTHAPFSPWTSQGYLARVIRSTCGNCGAQLDSLMGIFHVESRGTERREQIMTLKGFQLPPSAAAGVEYTPVKTAACLDCIPEAFLENRK